MWSAGRPSSTSRQFRWGTHWAAIAAADTFQRRAAATTIGHYGPTRTLAPRRPGFRIAKALPGLWV